MAMLNLKMRGPVLALAFAGMLGVAATADAATYKGRWDPNYGEALPDLGWRGEADFEIVDAGCLDDVVADGWVSNSGACAGKVRINSATVELYDIDSSLNGTDPSVVLSYGASQSPTTLRMYVDWVSATDKRVIAVEGGYDDPIRTTATFAKLTNSLYADYFLSFNGNQSNSPGLPVAPGAPDMAYSFLKSCSKFEGQAPKDCSTNDSAKFPAVMTIVPEPSAYLLGLASLAVVGVWTRRRRPAAAA